MGGPEGLAGFATRPTAPVPPCGTGACFLLLFVLSPEPVQESFDAVCVRTGGAGTGCGGVPSAGVPIRSPPGVPRLRRTEGSLPPADLPEDEVVSEDALAVSNAVLDATGKGDLPKALDLLVDAQRRHVMLPGFVVPGGFTGPQSGQRRKNGGVGPTAPSPPMNWFPNAGTLRGERRGRPRRLQERAGKPGIGRRTSPRSAPRYEFFWGEYLRRMGTPALALPHFQQAMRCRPSSADTDLIIFKQRLARIEVGNDTSLPSGISGPTRPRGRFG